MRQRGFTLIEVLFGLAILGLVITTSLAVFYERERRLRAAEETIVAYQILANEAEVQRQVPYSQLTPDETMPFASDPLMIARLRNATVEASVEQTHFAYKTVRLTIRWNDGARTATLSVIRSNTGGSNLW
ncbi:MAG TPA: type II secretion system protein [Thermoanaerobaculia bacterium]